MAFYGDQITIGAAATVIFEFTTENQSIVIVSDTDILIGGPTVGDTEPGYPLALDTPLGLTGTAGEELYGFGDGASVGVLEQGV